MNDGETDLMRRLADADTPPPPGAPFDATRLQARARARTWRKLAAAVLLAAALPLAFLHTEADRREPDSSPAHCDVLAGELRAMAAQVAHWQALLRAGETRPIDAPLRVRSELAAARAAAVVAFHAEESRR